MPDADQDLLRFDYEQTMGVVQALTDVRFKLLAFVPTIAGATVALLSDPASAAQLVAVGLLGFVATVGVLMYELRNTQLYDAAVHRARFLEQRLQLPSARSEPRPGGVFSERPAHPVRVLGRVPAWQSSLALVYAAALTGWAYLVGWGVLSAAEVNGAREWGAALGVVVGVVVLIEITRSTRRPDERAVAGGNEETPPERGV